MMVTGLRIANSGKFIVYSLSLFLERGSFWRFSEGASNGFLFHQRLRDP
jgi:hypothetical protein